MKNKTITIYKLLGLIKEGKAPEKIQHNDIIWNYTSSFKDYYYNGNYFFNNETLAGKLWILEHLNDTVEILDETNDEFEDIKELNIKQEYTDKGNLHDYLYYQDSKYALSLPQKLIIDNQNKIIRNQKKIIKKAKSNLECQLKTAELVKECEEQRQKLEKIIK